MSHQVLGLDITEEQLAAVIVEQKSGNKRIVAYSHEIIDTIDQFDEKIASLLSRLTLIKCDCVLGLPLGLGSLRNISLPFHDRKNIDQTLFFELEDLLITPVEEQVIEYLITSEDEKNSHLLVAGVDKAKLGSYLQSLQTAGCIPKSVTLRTIAYAQQIIECETSGDDFLVLDTGLHSLTLAICQQNKIVLVRNLPYPDQMVTDNPVYRDNTLVEGNEFICGEECIIEICQRVKYSINSFNLESGFHIQPKKIFVAGVLSHSDIFNDIVFAKFDKEVVRSDLHKLANVSRARTFSGKYQKHRYENALGLALGGFQKIENVNFLQGEFANKDSFFQSRQVVTTGVCLLFLFLAGFIGYFYMENRSLQKQSDQYSTRMKAIYKEAFPDSLRIEDPLKQMRIQLNSIQKNSETTPVIAGEKRVLGILTDISSRIPSSLSIHITRVVIDKETVRFKGTTDTFNNVNVIQKFLRKSVIYEEVDIVSATADKGKSKIRFEIRLKLREMS